MIYLIILMGLALRYKIAWVKEILTVLGTIDNNEVESVCRYIQCWEHNNLERNPYTVFVCVGHSQCSRSVRAAWVILLTACKGPLLECHGYEVSGNITTVSLNMLLELFPSFYLFTSWIFKSMHFTVQIITVQNLSS